MIVDNQAPRTAAIRAAIECAYEDADLTPPTVANASRIVPLQQLVAGQSLERTEHATLTRGQAAGFLSEQLPFAIEIEGAQDEELSGYLYANRSGGWILVNQGDPVVRRRYTVAHELGHYLLHALPGFEAGLVVFSEAQPTASQVSGDDEVRDHGVVRVVRADVESVAGTKDWEVEANLFAAELLMPADLCFALVDKYSASCGGRRVILAKRLASELLVSVQAMTYRLTHLSLGQP